MSECSNSVNKYVIVQTPPEQGVLTGLTVSGDVTICGTGNTLSVRTITGCTTEGININGNTFQNNGDVDYVSVLTVPVVNVTTLSGGTLYGDGSNLIGITDSYATYGTYSTGFITITGTGDFSSFNIDVSALLDDTNSYLTGATLNTTTSLLSLTLNNQPQVDVDLSPLVFTGGTDNCITDFYVHNIHGCSPITLVDDVIISGNTTIGGSLNIITEPVVDNTLIQILGRDSATGEMKYRDVQSIISAATSTDKYVTGATLNVNALEISRNGGLPNLSVDLSQFLDNTDNFITGGTMVGNTLILNRTNALSAVTVDMSQFVDDTNYYVTGSTLNGNTLELGRNGGLSTLTTDLSQFLDNTDNFITGATYNNNTLTIDRTNGSVNVDIPSEFVTGITFNPTTYDLTLSRTNGLSNLTSNLAVLASDIYVLSGVYNPSTGIVTYTNNSGSTFGVSGFTTGMTDSYTTNAYLNGNEIRFDNNIQGGNIYNVDLTPLLSGKTNNTDFWLHTGDTNNPHQTSFSNLTSTGHTHTLSEITDFSSYSGSVQTQIDSKVNNTTFTSYTANTQNILNTKIDGGINVGGGNEIFSGITGTDMNFRTLSGGSNTILTTIGDVVKIDVTLPSEVNTYVTGFTIDTNQLILTQNDGTSGFTVDLSPYIDNTDNYVTGGTKVNNSVVFGRNDTNNILTLSGGTNITISEPTTGIFKFDSLDTNTNTFVSGGTYSTGNIFFSGNSSETSFIVDVSALIDDTNYYVTGSTLNGNTLELGRNGGLPTLTTDLSQFIDNTDNYVTGGTMVGNTLVLDRTNALSAVTVDLSQFVDNTNSYVTGGTVSGTDLVLGRNGGLSDITIDTSPYFDNTNSYVTGFTYNNTNTLTLGRNGGLSDLSVSINTITGLTVNGSLSATTFYGDGSNLTGISTQDTYVTGGTYSNGTAIFSDNNGGTFSVNGFLTGSTSGGDYLPLTGGTVNGDVNINGQTILSNTGQNTLTIVGSGNTEPILLITGSTGELFSVTDTNDGTLYQINDSTANTIFEVYSDTRIVMGSYNAPSLYATTGVTVNSGTTIVYSFDTTNYDGVFVDYTLMNTLGARSGNMMGIFSGNSVQYTETSTNDIGDTSSISLSISTSGDTTSINTLSTTNSWAVKTIIRSI